MNMFAIQNKEGQYWTIDAYWGSVPKLYQKKSSANRAILYHTKKYRIAFTEDAIVEVKLTEVHSDE